MKRRTFIKAIFGVVASVYAPLSLIPDSIAAPQESSWVGWHDSHNKYVNISKAELIDKMRLATERLEMNPPYVFQVCPTHCPW